MPPQINTAAVIALYLLAVMAIGALSKRRHGLEEFHLAGRRLRPLLLTGTLCATIVGASSTLGMASLGFLKGLPGAWWMLSGTAGLLVLGLFFVGRIRGSGCSTLPELVGSFYGERMRKAASLLIAISWIGVISAQIVASGKVLGAVLGADQTLMMAACTAVFVLYTFHGGQSSVVRTDLIQLMLILAGIALLLFRAIDATGPGLLYSQSFPTSPEMGGWDVLSMLIVVGSAYLIGPDVYSRFFCAVGAREARASSVLVSVLLVPLAFMIALLGVAARELYPEAQPEQAIMALMGGLLSPEAEGLVAAALLAAFMSSADTSLMTATSILTLDIYRGIRPGSSEGHLITVSRIMVISLGILSLILATSLSSIVGTLLLSYTVFTSGLLMPIAAGFYRERLGLTPEGALAALAGGGASALLFGQSYPLLGVSVSAVLLFAVSLVKRRLSK